MGLPALAALGTSFNTSPAAIGLTLSLFMAGFAIAQLVFGPFSDRYGRRPILLVGCGVFALANVMCAIAPHRLIHTYRRVLGDRICVGYTLVNGLSFGCLFTYVAGSPLVLIDVLGLSTTVYGWFFALTALAIMAGSFLNGRLSVRGVPPSRLLKVGSRLAVASAIALLLVSISNNVRVATLMPLLVLNTFCFGLIAPNAKYGALQPLPEVAGVAAAVLGFMQMLLGGTLASVFVAFLYDGRTATAMTSVMMLFALASFAAYANIVQPVEKRIARASFNHYSNSQKT
jgi:DHA1 family bicyclomycin/chloramphenicol resistance-like MFS transporter